MDSKAIALNVMDLPFAKDLSELVIGRFQTDLIESAEKNWCPEQVKMLKALIDSVCTGIPYAEAYEEGDKNND